eukprot:110714_1
MCYTPHATTIPTMILHNVLIHQIVTTSTMKTHTKWIPTLIVSFYRLLRVPSHHLAPSAKQNITSQTFSGLCSIAKSNQTCATSNPLWVRSRSIQGDEGN